MRADRPRGTVGVLFTDIEGEERPGVPRACLVVGRRFDQRGAPQNVVTQHDAEVVVTHEVAGHPDGVGDAQRASPVAVGQVGVEVTSIRQQLQDVPDAAAAEDHHDLVDSHPRRLPPDLVAPLLIALASRALVLALLAIATVTGIIAKVAGPPPWRPPFGIWDGAWYVGIAEHGYHATALEPALGGIGYHDYAFFPVWPALLSIAKLVIDPAAASGILANGFFVAAALVAYRAFEPRFGRNATLTGVALLAFNPSAYVFSLGYAESLFLLISAVAFLPAARPWRPALAFIAQLTRLTGFAISAIALAGPLAERRWPDRRELLLLVAGPLALVLWCAALALLTGDPLAYFGGSPVWLAASGLTAGPLSFLEGDQPLDYIVRSWALLAIALPLIGAAILVKRRLWDLALFSLAVLLPGFILGNWSSMGRYGLVALPAFIALGTVVRGRLRAWLVGLTATIEIIMTIVILNGYGPP